MRQIPEKNKRNAKMVVVFGILLFILLVISMILHETGHILFCISTGNIPRWINIWQSECNGYLSSGVEAVIKFSGGIFSAFVLTDILLIFSKIRLFKNSTKYLYVVFITSIIIQLLNAIMEVSLPIEAYQAIAGNLYILLLLVFVIFDVVYLMLTRDKFSMHNLKSKEMR